MKPIRKLPLVGRLLKRRRPLNRVYRGIDSSRRRAPFLFYIIRLLFRAIAKTQHSEVEVIGLENIPPDGSVFLVGNHPNSFLDYFNLLTVIRHPLATAAKDTITNLPFLGSLLKNHGLMIPVSRAQDREESGISEEERQRTNEQMVRETVELLVTGRLFNIYAEGRSTDSRKLNRIRLGFMALALQAEKQFNFKLNLRIVPYGYYYDRINKFQSAACVIFGRPFKIKNLVTLPDDFQSMTPRERSALEKKIMVSGKNRLKQDIENIIISIEKPQLENLIDEAVLLYVKSPIKYMGPYENVREKYMLSKTVAESIQNADGDNEGKAALRRLNRLLQEYHKKLQVARLLDAQVRREYTMASVSSHLRALIRGLIYLPLIFYGFIVNYIPRLAGRFTRYWIIQIKKKEKVDGDEKAIIAAFVTVLVTYPLWGALIYFLIGHFLGTVTEALSRSVHFFHTPGALLAAATGYLATGGALTGVYLMARLWRFSLHHGGRLKIALFFFKDALLQIFRRRKLQRLRELRHEIIDTLDFIIGDYT